MRLVAVADLCPRQDRAEQISVVGCVHRATCIGVALQHIDHTLRFLPRLFLPKPTRAVTFRALGNPFCQLQMAL